MYYIIEHDLLINFLPIKIYFTERKTGSVWRKMEITLFSYLIELR
jgi:hypothetical protein